MKPYFIIFLLIPFQLSAQLKENFEDYKPERWKESTAGRWSISSEKPISGIFSLHHIFDNTIADHDQISLLHEPLMLDSTNATWKFKVRFEYDPSGYNNWAVILASDKDAVEMNPSGKCNAYILGVNYRGSDDLIKLWKAENNEISELISTTFNWQTEVGTENSASFEILRNTDGNWQIRVAKDSLSAMEIIGNGTDTAGLKISNYVGIYYKYSSSQDTKLWFDDLEIDGMFIEDTVPPTITGMEEVSQRHFLIRCNENITFSVYTNLEVTVSTIPYPFDSLIIEGNFIHIWLSEPVPNESEMIVEINNFKDLYGNLNPSDAIRYIYYQPEFNDVIITEIMADPTPEVLLPDAEYIELYNRSRYPINLDKWVLCVGTSCVALGSYIIYPDNYLVICNSQNLPLVENIPSLMGSDKLPQLTNDGQLIVLKDLNDQLIFSIQYSKKWYQDDSKSDGGWSLEMIDPENPCGGSENWRASEDFRGGTPGYQNSVYAENPDNIAPGLLKCVVVDDSLVYLHFSEPVIGKYLSDKNTYVVDNGFGNPRTVSIADNLLHDILLCYDKPFSNNIRYTLQITNEITDCVGNIIERNTTVLFKKPLPCDSFDLVINEILFDPYLQGGDFVEIYNRSQKSIDLKDFSIALKEEFTGKLTSRCLITSSHFTLDPGDYLALSKFVNLVTSYYRINSVDNFLEMENFPNLPNESGIIVLTDANDRIIDEVTYTSEMHAENAVNTKGISLERISCNSPSNLIANWYSSSGDAGNATPGYHNSQAENDAPDGFTIKAEPEIFTPDGDGYKDQITISYTMKESGFYASMTIFDRVGRPVRKITRNAILGATGEFIWDGRDDNDRLVSVGPYLIFTEIFNMKGTVKKFKNGCIIAEKIFR